MPKLLPQYFTDLAAKLGIKTDDPAFVTLMAKKELANITLSDEEVNLLDSNIHSLDSAAAQLKSKLHAEALNGIDKTLEREMEELGLDDAAKAALKGEASTSKRVSQILKKIKELESAKAKAPAADKKEFTDQINALNQKLSDTVNAHNKALDEQKNSYEGQITDLMYGNLLAGYNLAVPKGFTKEDILLIARNKLNAAMNDAGQLRITRDNGQMKLVKPDGTDYFDKSNNKKDVKSFTESVLAQNNLLQTTETPIGGSNPSNPATIPSGPKLTPGDAKFMSELDAKIEEAKAAMATP
jgi:hypothetical protein